MSENNQPNENENAEPSCGCGESGPSCQSNDSDGSACPSRGGPQPSCGCGDCSPNRLILMFVLMLCVVGGAWYYSMMEKPQQGEDGVVRQGQAEGESPFTEPVVPVHLIGWVGSSDTLSDALFQDKVTLINFWATWCGPCKIEFPHLVELQKQFADESDFQFISVSVDDPTPEMPQVIDGMLKQYEADFPVYMDPDHETMTAIYQNAIEAGEPIGDGIPLTVMLDKQGVIAGVWVGYSPAAIDQMREGIDYLLQQEATDGTTDETSESTDESTE